MQYSAINFPGEKDGYLFVIGAVVSVCQPSGLSIGNCARFSTDAASDGALLSVDNPNLESGVLRLEDDLMPVETIEDFGSILSG